MLPDVITSSEALQELRSALLRRGVQAKLTMREGEPELQCGLVGYEYGKGRVTVTGGEYRLSAPDGARTVGPVGRGQYMRAADRILAALGWGPRV